MQAIILCGGFGTRLSSLIQDLPKAMAPINEEPFLSILISYLVKQGVTKIVLASGYKSEYIQEYFGETFKGVSIRYSVEITPLGTGGAVLKALRLINEERVIILNGDTFFDVDLKNLFNFDLNSEVSVALKHITGSSRYNFMLSDKVNNLTAIQKKGTVSTGFVNGGVMIIKRNIFDTYSGEENFGLEDFIFSKDKLSKIKVFKSEGYFIDIGTPEDYKRAQNELKEYQLFYSK